MEQPIAGRWLAIIRKSVIKQIYSQRESDVLEDIVPHLTLRHAIHSRDLGDMLYWLSDGTGSLSP